MSSETSDRVSIAHHVRTGDVSEQHELPFEIAVLGDFLGHRDYDVPLRDRKLVQVIPENLDDVIRAYRPELTFAVPDRLNGNGGSIDVALRFERMSDFEPTAVVAAIEPLRRLLDQREAAANIFRIMSDALEDALQDILHDEDALAAVARHLDGGESPHASAILERLRSLGGFEATPVGTELAADFFLPYLQGVVRGDILRHRDVDAALTQRVADLDALLSRQLDEIQHHPHFMRLEAAWRGLAFLVERAAGPRVTIRLLQARQEDLLDDYRRKPHFSRTELFRKVAGEYQLFGGVPLALVIGVYDVGHGARDLELLEFMSELGTSLHVPFVTAASAALLNLDSFAELPLPRDLAKITTTMDYEKWRSFRGREEARHVALALPRFVLRDPYGRSGTVVESFDYEESADGRRHDHVLWGNPAFVIGACIARLFDRTGWFADVARAGRSELLDGLAMVPARTDFDAVPRGTTEVTIADRRARELAELGLVPLKAWKGTRRLIVDGMQTMCRPIVFDSDEKTLNWRRATRLACVLIADRVAQHFLLRLRDRGDRYTSAADVQEDLLQWISPYVAEHPGAGSPRASTPFKDVRIDAERAADGRWRIVASIGVTYGFDPPVTLRIVAQEPQPRS